MTAADDVRWMALYHRAADAAWAEVVAQGVTVSAVDFHGLVWAAVQAVREQQALWAGTAAG